LVYAEAVGFGLELSGWVFECGGAPFEGIFRFFFDAPKGGLAVRGGGSGTLGECRVE